MNEHEEKTVDAFIVREKRERYKSLLSNARKRAATLARLNHFRDLDENYATWLPSNAPIEMMLRQAGSPEEVYIISSVKGIDGKLMSLDDAVHKVVASGWGTIISCIPGQLAYYHGEEREQRAILQRRPSA